LVVEERILIGFGFMSEVQDKHNLDLLREMVKERKRGESPEEVLSIFCEREGISMDTCRAYYRKLVEKGEIKGK
jgi:predicted solute-binding protein